MTAAAPTAPPSISQPDYSAAGSPGADRLAPTETARTFPAAANAKLEQLKDLYLTAEAIGEDALDRHFEQVSQRQRELIKEFFDRSGPGGATES